jgi:hypothetical protein
MPHHRKIMADEQDGEAELAPDLEEQIDDLCLDGDIEGGDWLVGDQEARLHHDCPRDADALALAAREFMREALGIAL